MREPGPECARIGIVAEIDDQLGDGRLRPPPPQEACQEAGRIEVNVECFFGKT